MQRENKQHPWIPIAFYSKGLNEAQKKYSTYDLSYLAEMMADFEYVAGPLNTAADALSLPPAED